jgi:hypothetical protein
MEKTKLVNILVEVGLIFTHSNQQPTNLEEEEMK